MKRFLEFISALILLASVAHAQVAIDGATYVTSQYSVTSGTVTSIGFEVFGDAPDRALCRVVTMTGVSDSHGWIGTTIPSQWGFIERVITDPGAAAPTTLWDCVLNDSNSADLFANAGQNQSATVTNQFVPIIGGGAGKDGQTTPIGTRPVLMAGPSTLIVSNAGDSKNIVIKFTLRKL